jgi:hypothetical protein
MNAIRHGRELGQPRVRRHRLSIAGGGPPAPPPITGTPPVLGPLSNGDTLNSATTWGTYSGTGTVTTQRQARLNGGTWDPYVGTTVVLAGQTWQLRERVSDDFNTNQVFLGNSVVVSADSLDDQVQALLAGRTGTVFDLGDNATRFTDQAATIPVTAPGQSVQAVKSKWGTLAYTYSVANVAAAPLAEADALLFDGVDDYLLGNAAVLGFLNNAPAVTVGITFSPAGVGGGTATAIYFSRGASATQNRLDLMRSTAALRFLSKRLDADANTTFTSAAGTLTAGQWSSALLESDFAGSGRMETWLDGDQLAGAAISGTVGNSEAIGSAQAVLGAAAPTSSRFGGRIRKVFFARFELTPGEKTIVQDWLEEA